MEFNFSKLSIDLSERLYQIARELRFDFVDFVDGISEKNQENLFYWISNLASRNIVSSSLFNDFCKFELLREVLHERKIGRIVLPSGAYFQVLAQSSLQNDLSGIEICIEKDKSSFYFYPKNSESIKNEATNKSNKTAIDAFLHKESACKSSYRKENRKKAGFFCIKLKAVLRSAYSLLQFTRGYLRHTVNEIIKKRRVLRQFPPKRLLGKNDEIILFHTYLMDKSFAAGVFQDRYFTNLFDYLSEEEKRNIYFIFTPYEFPYNRANLSKIRKNPCLLIKDDYLQWTDYLHAFLFPFRIKKIKLTNTRFGVFDFAPLLKEAIDEEFWRYANGSTQIYFEAVFNFRLLKRLKARGVKIKKVIDWFENQWMNRGLYFGLARYYPKTPSVGYEGYFADLLFLSLYPSRLEVEARVVPDAIAVIGSKLVSRSKQFYKKLNVLTAPAFRYSHVYSFQPKQRLASSPKRQILCLLPYELKMLDRVFEVARQLMEDLRQEGVRIKFRPHPVVEKYTVNRLEEIFSQEFLVSKGSMQGDLSESMLALSYESSAVMEALAYGRPVVLIGNPCGMTLNPIPEGVPSAYWRLCFGNTQIIDAVRHFLGRDNSDLEKYRETLKRDFFEPVTREAVLKLLR